MTRLGSQAFSAPPGTTQAAEAALGRPFSAASIYQKLDDASAWPTPDAVAAKANNALIYLNINAVTDPTNTGNKTPASWLDITGGGFDPLLLAWANALVTDGYNRIILTIEHEANVNNAQQPKSSDFDITRYPAMFAYVRDLMQANGVTYHWAFVPTVSVYGTGKYKSFMPDPAHFEVIGADVYGHANDRQTFAQKVSPMMTLAQSLGKRVLIGELGCDNPSQAVREAWIQNAAAFFLTQPPTADGKDRVNMVSFNLKPSYGVVGSDLSVNPVWVQAVQGYK